MEEEEHQGNELCEQLRQNREHLKLVEEELRGMDPQDENYGLLAELRRDLLEAIEISSELLGSRVEKESVGLHQEDTEVGRVVEVFYKGAKRHGRVESKKQDASEGGTIFTVSLFSQNPQEKGLTFQSRDLRFLPLFKGLSVGEKVQTLYEDDGCWYNSEITELLRDGYIIRYLEYDQREKVPFDRVRMAISGSRGAGSGEKRRASVLVSGSEPVVTTPGGYRIPESLIIKPQDSESTKLEKKRKVSIIKKQQRGDLVESKAKERQLSWKSHQSKFQSKGKELT
ncbi:malic enzyme [Cryptosporidium felis]|nr:malic enzyme [Cryptosporidium felis]